jgi:hypothetical protein
VVPHVGDAGEHKVVTHCDQDIKELSVKPTRGIITVFAAYSDGKLRDMRDMRDLKGRTRFTQ